MDTGDSISQPPQVGDKAERVAAAATSCSDPRAEDGAGKVRQKFNHYCE